MLEKQVLKYNAIFFAVFGALSLVFGLTGLGAMAIIFAVINLFTSLILFSLKKNDKAKTCLLVGGCLLLVGFALCSSFPFKLN